MNPATRPERSTAARVARASSHPAERARRTAGDLTALAKRNANSPTPRSRASVCASSSAVRGSPLPVKLALPRDGPRQHHEPGRGYLNPGKTLPIQRNLLADLPRPHRGPGWRRRTRERRDTPTMPWLALSHHDTKTFSGYPRASSPNAFTPRIPLQALSFGSAPATDPVQGTWMHKMLILPMFTSVPSMLPLKGGWLPGMPASTIRGCSVGPHRRVT